MISYKTTNLGAPKQDGYSQVLNEAKALFDEQHVNILGEGYQEILSDNGLFEDYKAAMLKGVDADEQDSLAQLIDNSRMTTLQESLSGVTPISSLSVPTIRKLWPRMAMKNAIPTEVVKLPKFSVSYLLPYIIKNGVRHYLPEAIMDGGSAEGLVEGQSLWNDWLFLADTDYGAGIVDGATKGFDLLGTLPGAAVASAAVGDSVDPDFHVIAVRITTTHSLGGDADAPVDVEQLRIGCGLNGDVFYAVSAYHPSDLDVDGNPLTGAVPTTDNLFGRVDRVTGTLTLATTGGFVLGVKIKGKLSSEFNMHTESISFDIQTRDLTIGTGTHLNAPLPIEFLQDVMAMYNIDGAAKVVDIMTNTLALKLDHELRDFIVEGYARDQRYPAEFDLKPYAQFSGTPKAWREMLKDVIDHYATKLKQDRMFTGGKFVIIGNDLDCNLLPNVTWTFVGSAGERSGVEADYSLGAISGANRYEIVSTPAMPQGYLYVIFVSSQDEQMTYKYFPYSFNVEKGYSDPQYSLVPSIMIAKRHLTEYFNDAIFRIEIKNNTGAVSWPTP